MNKRLTDMIDKFLKERRRSKAGWAEVREGDVAQLGKIVGMLIEAKFERDPDGDLPVEYTLVDRTRYHRLSFMPVGYNKEQPLVEQLGLLRDHFVNLDIAFSHVRTTIRLCEDTMRRESEKP